MNNGCILYAEDEADDVFLLQHAFAQAKIPNPLQIVKDGQEAIDYLAGVGAFADRHQYPLPCLVLLDQKTPRKTGFEVLQWLRAQPHLRCLPVIMFTASPLRGDIETASLLGANSFVIKPNGVMERIKFVQALQAYWLNFHAAPQEGHVNF